MNFLPFSKYNIALRISVIVVAFCVPRGAVCAATPLPELDVSSAELRPVKLSYHFVRSYMQAAADLSDPNYPVQPVILTGKRQLSPRDLDATIQSKSGIISIPIDRDGGVLTPKVPDGLEKEDPVVMVNQRKGYAFSLTIQVVLPVPTAKDFSYSMLQADVKWANHVFRRGPAGSSF